MGMLEVGQRLFFGPEARWAGVVITACSLTLPVAGTSLYIADQYLTPRSIVSFAVLFAVHHAWNRRYIRFAAWSAFAAVIHPLMAVFGLSFAVLLLTARNMEEGKAAARNLEKLTVRVMAALPFLPAASEAYRTAVQTRSYFFILRWEWYEWVGIFAPLLLLWWFGRIAKRNGMLLLKVTSHSLIAFDLLYFAAALLLTIPPVFMTLARLQPLRSLHLLYTFLMVFGGGLIGRNILRRHVWRWLALFLPICTGMWFAQLQLFPASAHIEWPGANPSNDWLRAFGWIRINTPSDAIFALDPEYMLKDDQHGFRAVAERSRLADLIKDSGAVTMFPAPPMAEDWLEQTTDEKGWSTFRQSDFRRLKNKYGVSWVLLERPAVEGLMCPYENKSVLVCRIDGTE